MENDRLRVKRLLKEKSIICTIDPDPAPSEEHPSAIGWRVTFRYNGHTISSLFYTSYQPPTPEQVMDTWINETHLILEGESYETWCNEKNLDPDEERSDKLWRQADLLAGNLERFLGDDLNDFLYAQ